jgi:hypothetical protein
MSFLFGNTDNAKKEVAVRKPLAVPPHRLNRNVKEISKINDKYRNIKAKIQELFPEIDIDFFEKIQNYEYISEEEYNSINKYFNYKFDELSYNKFIAYKFDSKIKHRFINFNKIDEKDKANLPFSFINEDYDLFLDSLNKINPYIFMSNVNLDWKILQLAKNDKSIKIPPNAPPLPSPPKRSSPKRSSPKKSKSKLTKEDLEMAKSKLKPKGPPKPPPLQLSPKRSSPKKSKSKLTKEGLEIAKSKLKPKSPPKPPPLPSPPKRSSPKKSKSKLTKEELEIAKSKLKPKGPPYPPPLPSPPKRSSPKKSKSKLTKEELEIAKSKLKHSQKNIKPDDPDYDLEMAFRNLEK